MFKDPKSQKARRAVVLPPMLTEELKRYKVRQDVFRKEFGESYATDLDLIFCQPNGKPLHGHNVAQRDFRRIIKRMGLPRIRFHDLRHCHASHLLRQGVHPKVVQERLGHSTPGFTLHVYSHLLPGMQEQTAHQLEEHLFGYSDEGGTPHSARKKLRIAHKSKT